MPCSRMTTNDREGAALFSRAVQETLDTVVVPEDSRGRHGIERQLPREVLLVLELDGPAWQQALERISAASLRGRVRVAVHRRRD